MTMSISTPRRSSSGSTVGAVADQADRQRGAALLRGLAAGDRVVQAVGQLVEVAVVDAALQPRPVDVDHEADAVVQRDGERLRAAHAAAPAGHGQRAGQGAAEPLLRHRGERLVRALQDPLRADVDPRAGRHLAVHREAELLQPAELRPGRPVADEVGVRDQHPRRPLVRAHDADGLARLHQHRLVVAQRGERADHRVERAPVAGRAAGAAVDDEVVGAFRDLGIEVVLQHPQRGLGLPRTGGQGGAARCADGTCAFHGTAPSSEGSGDGLGGGQRRAGGDGRDGRLDLGGQVPVRARPGDGLAQRVAHRRGGRGRRQRAAQVDAAGGGEQLDREHLPQPVDGAAQLARRRPAHRHVVLLHRARRDRVHRCRHGQPLQLRDDRGLRVLGDHVPGVDARVVGEERRQPVAARLVEEPVGAPLGDRRQVGDGDREEVQHVPDRRAVEVAVATPRARRG